MGCGVFWLGGGGRGGRGMTDRGSEGCEIFGGRWDGGVLIVWIVVVDVLEVGAMASVGDG